MRTNLLLLADAYKYSHYKLYVPGTTKIYSYLESRGGMFDETVFYGLQYFLKEYLSINFWISKSTPSTKQKNGFTTYSKFLPD